MSEWFERHPEFLAQEAKQLSSNGNYEEAYQVRENLFASVGWIKVRVGRETLQYPVAIVYLKATPYILPKVFLLSKLLEKEEVEALAKMQQSETSEFFKSKAKFYYRRHQNSDGSLCILEQDNLDQGGPEVFDANSIINRVRSYLAGLTTGRFPLEGEEVELFSHYPHQSHYHVMLTDDFYVGAGEKGEFYLCFAYDERRDSTPNIYFGGCLVNKTASGIQTDESLSALRFMPKGLQTRYEIVQHTEQLTEAIKNKELIEGHWWHLLSEPEVFQTTDELMLAIGKGEIGRGVTEVEGSFWPKLKNRDEAIFLGIRFPNRRKELDWVILVLKQVAKNNPPLIIGKPNVQEVLRDYLITAAYSVPLTEEKHHLRNKGRVDYATMKERSLTIIGCGAIGSEIADIMGKGGVGNITLVDNQIMNAHNSIRHLANVFQANQPKVNAVKTVLIAHNPYIAVSTSFQNILTADLDEYFSIESIGISSIADDNTEGYLNEQAILSNRTVFYSRALRGGKAGRIFRVIPGQDACFNCLSIYREEGHPDFVEVPEDKDLPTLRNECNNPIRPSSAADLKLIASLTGRLIFDYINNPYKQDSNHWIWQSDSFNGAGNNESIPFGLKSKKLFPHPKCPYCQSLGPLKVKIGAEVLKFMQGQVFETPGIETGGVLVGRLKGSENCVEIISASGPGPLAKKTSSKFERDVEYCQNFVNQQAISGLLYLGEWHSHPNNCTRPSGTDIKSLSAISGEKEYLTTRPIMIIFSRIGEFSCTVHPVNLSYYVVDPVITH